MIWNELMDRLRIGLADRRARHEFRRLRSTHPDIAAAIAHEAGTTPSELELVASAGRRAARLRERMLEAFDIDPEELSTAEFGALRETGITCSHCRSKRRCAIELHRGTARANAASFCPNASTFAALVAGRR
jgi:hypothetical protein